VSLAGCDEEVIDGLTSSGTTFKALFDMSQPIATAGKSDLFANSAS
jgi:hypothetical protein